jgi:hypothetical protein
MVMKIYVCGEFNNEEMHVIWRYNYLEDAFESFNRRQKSAISRYEKMVKLPKYEVDFPLYTKGINKKLETVQSLENNFEYVREEKIEEIEFINSHVPKSQILNINMK